MKPFIILFVAIWLCSFRAQASESRYSLGLNLGLSDKQFVTGPEVENNGELIEGHLGVSLYSEEWIGDFRLGYHYDKMDDNDVEVETKAFFAEMALKYKWFSSFSFGPAALIAIGEDVSFSDTGTNSDDNSVSLFLGPKLSYDFYGDDHLADFQIGLSYLWDVEIDNRQVSFARIHLAWMFGGDSASKPTAEPKPPPVVKKVDPIVAAAPEPEKGIKINLKTAGVNFASASSELNQKSREVVEKLAAILAAYPDDWQLIRVDGHTDSTGNYENNIQLSRLRAESVAAVFVEKGLPKDRVVARGFGPDRPLMNETTRAALAANRRVEVNVLAENASPGFVKAVAEAFPE